MARDIHVMVAILRDAAGRVLIAQRPPGKTLAGRWEFPGGKLELHEAAEAGLRRELLEELGVVAGPMRCLLEITHRYPDVSVRLDVREVEHFGGQPRGREGQTLRWLRPEQLPDADILEADRPIVQALRLPDMLLITPDPATLPRKVFLEGLSASLDGGVRLVQLRAPLLDPAEYVVLARQVLEISRHFGAQLLLNSEPDLLAQVFADGIHLNGARLRSVRRRPLPADKWFSVSCHTEADLRRAEEIGADFALLSPVYETASHPTAITIGWPGFTRLARAANIPVYALGGVSPADLAQARRCGGRGVAAIRSLWRGAFR